MKFWQHKVTLFFNKPVNLSYISILWAQDFSSTRSLNVQGAMAPNASSHKFKKVADVCHMI